MKNLIKKIAIGFAVFVLPLQPLVAQNMKCVLKGEVIDRPESRYLVLLKDREDFRITDGVQIPIQDGTFEYVLNCDFEEMYQFIFLDEMEKSSWRPIKFFSENGTVNFKLYPQNEWLKNKIEGGALNTDYYALEKNAHEIIVPLYEELSAKRELLHKEGKMTSPEAQEIYEKLKTAKNDELNGLYRELEKLRNERRDLTPEGLALQDEDKRTFLIYRDMKWKYAQENPTIAGYEIVMDATWSAAHSSFIKQDIEPIIEIYNTVYAKKYPNHPYTEQIKNLINSVTSIKVGGKYIDFEAIDSQNNNIKLSEQIQGKIALIHLWASWCGPCRRNGMSMIPVYEAYKDKGFTVVGIARENTSSLKAMRNAIERDKYPWLNLVELNDKEQIWTKYGRGNAGGGEFLVDGNGIILAIDPTAEEVEKILAERLK